ncbi:MAG: DNA gyrase inhibitor YacG [Planctomycetota bacterium]|nr:MAG: DNA gyrase inhibitor YacG [Planctomycetota bacterium]
MKHMCPICKKTVRVSSNNKSEEARHFPFCSRRCKLIDLGAWLDTEYKITSKAPDSPSDGSSGEN